MGAVAGSVTVTVFTSGSVTSDDAKATGAVNVSALPAPAASVAAVVPNVVCPVRPVTVPHVAVPVATQVAFAVKVTPGGSGSFSARLSASVGPAFVTVMMYVPVLPGVYVALLSVFVTAIAACAERVSLSDALPLAPDDASLAVTVLISGSSIMVGANVTGAVNVSRLPPPLIVAAVVPKVVWPIVPVTAPHVAAPVGVQVTVPVSVTPGGNASFTVTLSAS